MVEQFEPASRIDVVNQASKEVQSSLTRRREFYNRLHDRPGAGVGVMGIEYGPEDYNASYFGCSEVSRPSNYDASYTHPGIVKSAALRLGAFLIALKFRGKLGLGRIEVLDIGGGTGIFASHLSHIPGVEACNLDLSTWATRHADGSMRGLTVQGSAPFLPFKDAHFDGVVSFNVFEHITEDSISRVARESYRVLRPGGRGILIVNTGEFDDFEGDESHITKRNRSWWDGKFVEAGFCDPSKPVLSHLSAIAGRVFPMYSGLLVVDKPE